MMDKLARVFLLTVVCALMSAASIKADSPGLTPLNSLGEKQYQGFQGGLYAGGKNEPWGSHAEAFRRQSTLVQPLNRDGKPDAQGKIVFVGIGASVCRQLFATLETLAPETKGINPAVVIVNCARGGHDVNKIADTRYWELAKEELVKRDFSPAQVQLAWYQSDDLRDTRDDFPGRPQRLKENIAGNMRLLKEQFPNTRICYHSARHTTAFSPEKGAGVKHGEPRPYQVGWAVKWLIEDQAAGKDGLQFEGSKPAMPLVAWSTYFWTDGDQPRHDGYKWTRDDVVPDGVHLSKPAQERVAKELIAFFSTDPFTKTWFAATSTAVPTAKPTPPPQTPAVTSAPTLKKSDNPRDPAWIVNGKDKIPKLQRLLGTTDGVRVVVKNLKDEQVAEIRDVFKKRSDLNEIVGSGEYRLEFYDKDGKLIKLTQEVGEILRLK